MNEDAKKIDAPQAPDSGWTTASAVVRDIRSGRLPPRRFIPTGIARLDQLLGGGLTQGLIVLGAMSSLGKSTLVIQIAQNAAKTSPVLLFSLEMPAERVTSKMISRQTFLQDRSSARTAEEILSDPLAPTIAAAYEEVEQGTDQLYLMDMAGEPCSAEEVVARVRQLFEEKSWDKADVMPLVIVDYLQILRAPGTNMPERAAVDENIRQLRRLAKTMPVLLISSINREGYEKEMSMSSFKESGGIEFSSDVLLGMQYTRARTGRGRMTASQISAERSDPRKVELVVLKHRYGESGSGAVVPLDYYAKYNHFAPAADRGEAETHPAASVSLPRGKAGSRRKRGASPADPPAPAQPEDPQSFPDVENWISI